jgi:carboxyl-terminal processing protease
MDNGSLLKLTVARWYTPDGVSIEEAGISPDIEVEFQKEDYENKYDRQLEEAKKILQLYNKKGTI